MTASAWNHFLLVLAGEAVVILLLAVVVGLRRVEAAKRR